MGSRWDLREARAFSPEDPVGPSDLPLVDPAYRRPTILVLLRERQTTGDDLVLQMGEMGFEARATTGIFHVLRAMEREGLISSSPGPGWQPHRPDRRSRIYAVTKSGEEYLLRIAPTMSRHREALDAMLTRYQASSA